MRCVLRPIQLSMALLFALGVTGFVTAQGATPNDLTGFWALRVDSRNVPKAHLLPTITATQIAQHQAADRNAIRWCLPVGVPSLMDAASNIGIVQGAKEVAVRSEAPSAARHIYLDRDQPPGADVYEPTTNGFSIGHWEGDALLVETTGFSDKGVTGIPGGGYRTPTAKLMERYELVDHGRQLQVTFTWTDPHVYAQPHTYAFRYYRMPAGYNAGEVLCDASNADRANFLTKTPIPVTGPRSHQ